MPGLRQGILASMLRGPATLLLVLLTAPLLAACGADEGELTLRLVRASFDDPYADLQRFELRLLDDRYRQLEQQVIAQRNGALDLGLTEAGQRRLVISGQDSDGRVLSRGYSRLLELQSGEAAAESIPFSTTKVAAALPASSALVGGAIQVDGSLAEWTASPSLVLDGAHRTAGSAPAALDLRAELALAWEGTRLLFALRVSDDCPALKEGAPAGDCGAAGETERVFLGFDGADDGGDSYDKDDLWIEIKATRLWVRQGELTPQQIAVVMVPLPGARGWALEGALQVSALGLSSVDEKSKVGLELMVVDRDPGEPDTVLRWSGHTKTNEATPPSAMGTLGFTSAAGKADGL